jgi:adiponectin receptor
MAYTSTCTTTRPVSREEPTLGASSGAQFDIDHDRAPKRRRHSAYQSRSRAWSIDRDDIQELMDGFLVDLGKRLEMVETYGHLNEGLKRAHGTLQDVYERCKQTSDDIMDAGRRRARIMVETLESRYQGALTRKATLEQKVQEGVKIMEAVCSDLERRAYDMRNVGFAATAHEMFDSGKAYMDNASTKAAEIVSEGAEAARRAKEMMRLKVEEAIAQARKHGVISYDVLPEPWRVNPHIISGYRFSETKLECIRSCFTTLSNETVNIWSHAIGLIIVLAIAFYFYPSSAAFSEATKFDIFIAGCFFFAACKCLVCSMMWHTMCSISNQSLMESFACVDYTGISLLVASSIMTTEYTAFYCEPVSRYIYISITFILGCLGALLAWNPSFNRPDYAWIRVGFYVSLATTGFIPIIQLTLQRGWNETAYFYAPITKSILVYLGGALLYAAKLPERLMPGWFDYAGQSHNIWHLAVLGGILYHYEAMHFFFSEAFRRSNNTECSIY